MLYVTCYVLHSICQVLHDMCKQYFTADFYCNRAFRGAFKHDLGGPYTDMMTSTSVSGRVSLEHMHVVVTEIVD